jgi:hypothetical protein
LTALKESPWGEWNRGKSLSQNQLTKMLKSYGIFSRDVRVPPTNRVAKGYTLQDFEDAFARYLPPSQQNDASSAQNTDSNRYNATSGSTIDHTAIFESATDASCSVSENGTLPAPDAGCSVVADSNAAFGEEEEIFEEDHGT